MGASLLGCHLAALLTLPPHLKGDISEGHMLHWWVRSLGQGHSDAATVVKWLCGECAPLVVGRVG